MDSPAHNQETWSTDEPARATSGRTSCSVRPWLTAPHDVHWSSGHAGIYLMADLLTACGGQLVVEPGPMLTAQFDRPERAMTAAKRLQHALCAFADNPSTEGFAASVVIHKPEDQVRSRSACAPHEMLWSSVAVPGQILVSGSAHEILQFVPGLQFRPTPVADDDSGLAYQELLWTDSETLDVWQSRVVAATRVIGTPEPNSPDQAEEVVARIPELQTGAEDFPVEAVDERQELFQAASPGTPDGQQLTWIAGGAILFVAVLVLGGVFYFRSGRGSKAGGQQRPKEQSVQQQKTPEGKEFGEGSPLLEKHESIEKAKTESVEPTGAAKPQGVTRDPETGLTGYEGFTSKQVPQLLNKAERDAGAGNYDGAKREYEIVLKLQPGNAAAREGLHKLNLKIGESR